MIQGTAFFNVTELIEWEILDKVIATATANKQPQSFPKTSNTALPFSPSRHLHQNPSTTYCTSIPQNILKRTEHRGVFNGKGSRYPSVLMQVGLIGLSTV